MATVTELSDPYANFMLSPRPPAAPDVCSVCLTFTEGWSTCYPCGHQARFADAVLPISYSVAFGQLHTALQQYKRGYPSAARQFQIQLAAVLWRFVSLHEGASHAASVSPASTSSRPSRRAAFNATRTTLFAGWVVRSSHTRERHRRLLMRSGTPVAERAVDPGKFNPTADLEGEAVLLIDDTWTTGASVQSAAAALKTAGAGPVGVVVIGRHINDDYGANARRLKELSRPFEWKRCALHL